MCAESATRGDEKHKKKNTHDFWRRGKWKKDLAVDVFLLRLRPSHLARAPLQISIHARQGMLQRSHLCLKEDGGVRMAA
jgi:hypothetical protein